MGQPAARIGDSMMHGPPLLGAPCPTVLIGGKPAWRVGDQHTCPIPNAPPPAGPGTPHGPGITIPPGALNVLVGGKPAARMGDKVTEPGAVVPPMVINTILMGCMTVLIGTAAGGGGGGGAGGGGGGAGGGDGDKCTQEGHPVNVANGEVTASAEDLELPGLIPVRLRRDYSSARANQMGDFGYGWFHSLGYQLVVKETSVHFLDSTGRAMELPIPASGERSVLKEEGLALRRIDGYWVVNTAADRDLFFPDAGETERLIFPDKIQDSFGNAIEFKYRDGRLSALRDSTGRYVLFRRDRTGLITALELADRDPNRAIRIREYKYDEQGDLVGVIDGVGAETSYGYVDHLLVRETDRNGDSWFFTYDDLGRCQTTWGPDGLLYRRFEYGPDGDRRTLMTDAHGYQWVYEHNEAGYVTTLTTPLGYKEETRWSEKYEMIGKTDRNGNSELFEFHPDLGNVSKIIDAAGHTWAFEYNERGYETKFIDPYGHSVEKVYDEKGALREYRDPLGNVTRYEHDRRGLPTGITLPNGRKMFFTHDSYGFLAERRTEDDLFVEKYVHDFRGRLIEMILPDGEHLKQTFDNNDRLVKVVNSKGLVYEVELDGEGNVLRYLDAEGGEWRYKVDALGATTEEIAPAADPDGAPAVTRYLYDKEGHISGVVLPNGGRINYRYDGDRRMVAADYPDGRTVELVYDGEANVILRRNGDGGVVAFRYDALGRLVSKELTDADGTFHTHAFEYDAYGNITLAQNEEHLVETEYDALGRQIREVQDDNEFLYEYDEIGRRTLMVYPGGSKVRYRYDDDRRTLTLESSLHGAIVYQYDALYRPERIQFPNNVVEEMRYDERSKLIEQKTSKNGAVLFGRSYVRNKKGFRSNVVEHNGASQVVRYGGIDRVLGIVSRREDEIDEERLYEFDNGDNLISSPNGTRWKYDQADRLLESPNKSFRYNRNGETSIATSAQGSTRYEYDAEGMLLRVRKPDGTVVSFTYDALSRRTTKSVDGERTHFLWDFVVPAIEESPNSTSYYLHYPRDLVPVVRCDVKKSETKKFVYAYHIDAAGAVRGLTDDRGVVRWVADYSPLGEARIESYGVRNAIRVLGEYWDEEIEAGYHRMRYYDPTVGRFLTPDPQGLVNGPNLYAFQRNAFEFFDPFGDSSWDYVRAWGTAYENFTRAGTPGSVGTTFVQTARGARYYDNFVPSTNTYYEAKYIGQNGSSASALARMRGQLTRDASFLRSNKNANIRWQFNRNPPASIRRRLNQLQRRYPGRFSWEVKPTPPCFQSTYVDPELAKIP